MKLILLNSQNHSGLRINFSDVTVHLTLNLADSTTDWKHEFDDGTGSTKNPMESNCNRVQPILCYILLSAVPVPVSAEY